ncbi:MAG: 4Fe-4S binding protein [Candidatus Omnitrophota bacterium]
MIFFVRTAPFLILLLACLGAAEDIQRFPPPDFESGYVMPATTTPQPRAGWLNYLDLAVLFTALSLASYLVIYKRNRPGIFALTIFSLLYFGFYREGCVCSIGAIQNVAYSLFHANSAIPFVVIAFFLLPLIFALYSGRVFCAGVCPLGAIQDVVLIKPIRIPRWLLQSLGLIPYLYLGLAVLFAAQGSSFIICEYDPFVSFFRLSGRLNIIIVGFSLLAIGVFVGRPYCLFLCPYGAILRLLSRLSLWQVTVSPDECRQCQLCEEACPFGAIYPPTPEETQPIRKNRKQLAMMLVLLPILVALGSWSFSLLAPTFSRTHPAVRLAEDISLEDSTHSETYSDASQAFRDLGQSKEVLFNQARNLRNRFSWGAWILGGFFGFAVAFKLIGLSLPQQRMDYEIDNADCVACGRCFSYCPVELKRRREKKSSRSAPKDQTIQEQ